MPDSAIPPDSDSGSVSKPTGPPDALRPSKPGAVTLPPNPSASDEAPDHDSPAWEGAEPKHAVGLVDPRHEIPNPPGL